MNHSHVDAPTGQAVPSVFGSLESEFDRTIGSFCGRSLTKSEETD